MKILKNPQKNSDTELQCIFPVPNESLRKMLWCEDAYIFTDTDIIFRV